MDTIKKKFPYFVLAAEPVPKDELGRPAVESCTFVVIDDDHGTPLLLMFSSENLASRFVTDQTRPLSPTRTIEIETDQQLQFLLDLLSESQGESVGILLDPDGNYRGYPVPPVSPGEENGARWN